LSCQNVVEIAMVSERGDRWQTVYDADGLKDAIREIVLALRDGAPFYALDRLDDPKVCCGDVFRLRSDIPHIDENGDVVAVEGDDYWLVTGNTCDLERDAKNVTWTQAVPLVALPEGRFSASELADLKNYTLARRFYVPPWPGTTDPRKHFFADFL